MKLPLNFVEELQKLRDLSNTITTNTKRGLERRLEEDCPNCSGKKTNVANGEAGRIMDGLGHCLEEIAQ